MRGPLFITLLVTACGAPVFDEVSTATTRGPVGSVDVSVWSRTISPDEVKCWQREGIRHVIVGTQHRRTARQQAEQVLRGGLLLDAYVYLYWNRSVATQVAEALSIMHDLPIGTLWLDVEEPAPGITPAQMIPLLQDAEAACGQTRCGIYTSPGWWRGETGNSAAFAHLPLWYAYWDDRAHLGT